MTDTTNTPDPTVSTLAFLIADLYGQLRMAQAAVREDQVARQEVDNLTANQRRLSNDLTEAHLALSALQDHLTELEKLKGARIAELEEELAEMEEWRATKNAVIETLTAERNNLQEELALTKVELNHYKATQP